MAYDEHIEDFGDPKFKTTRWSCICWLENMRDDWRESLPDLIDCPGYYALHDSDVDSMGVLRKIHLHLDLYWNGNINRNTAKNIANRLSKPGVKCCSTSKPISRVRQAYEYAIHNTEKAQADGKHLYPEESRVCFNGFDIGFFEQLSQEERDRMVYDLAMLIHDRKIENLYDLQEILDSEYDFQHFLVFKGQNAFFDRLCRGVYLKNEQKKKKRNRVECEAFEPGRVAMSEAPLRDENGERVLVCRDCGFVGHESDFLFFGGEEGPNIGKCRFCDEDGKEKKYA